MASFTVSESEKKEVAGPNDDTGETESQEQETGTAQTVDVSQLGKMAWVAQAVMRTVARGNMYLQKDPALLKALEDVKISYVIPDANPAGVERLKVLIGSTDTVTTLTSYATDKSAEELARANIYRILSNPSTLNETVLLIQSAISYGWWPFKEQQLESWDLAPTPPETNTTPYATLATKYRERFAEAWGATEDGGTPFIRTPGVINGSYTCIKDTLHYSFGHKWDGKRMECTNERVWKIATTSNKPHTAYVLLLFHLFTSLVENTYQMQKEVDIAAKQKIDRQGSPPYYLSGEIYRLIVKLAHKWEPHGKTLVQAAAEFGKQLYVPFDEKVFDGVAKNLPAQSNVSVATSSTSQSTSSQNPPTNTSLQTTSTGEELLGSKAATNI